MQDASLAGEHLAETVLGEAFSGGSALVVSADGRRVAAGTLGGELPTWRVAERALLVAVLRGHTSGVLAAAFSPREREPASGGLNGSVRLWDRHRLVLRRTLRPDRRCERTDITGPTGAAPAQIDVLVALGRGGGGAGTGPAWGPSGPR
jgi:WD40 repeat protein